MSHQPSTEIRNNNVTGEAEVELDYFVEENTTSHYTDEYEANSRSLVLRRGRQFMIGMTFKGVTSSEILKTTLRFKKETSAKELSLFSYPCKVVKDIDSAKWEMSILEQDEKKLKLRLLVNIPVDVIVGSYIVDVLVPSSSKPLKQFRTIVIFNPWHKDDEVYLDDENLRKEYVLADNGLMYRGTVRSFDSMKWEFGQFEDPVLDCVLYLLQKQHNERSLLKHVDLQRSAVWVSRRLSALLNDSDENGVLQGNWSGDYENGVNPGSWSSSVSIFDQYFQTKKPVKYGQCWVFSGIMTTALRALGIPARSVSNFASAHDTDGTMTIDTYVDENGEHLNEYTDDSVWNFHVWNEIWTKRKDLPGDSYDGWQAVDCTPQERSFRRFQMGPAPLKAVKDGEIYAGFDSGFVFGEVNADRVFWCITMGEDGLYATYTRRKTHSIGKFISTKMVGKDRREDITHLYKYAEGSEEERKAFSTAYNFGKGPAELGELSLRNESKDLTIDIATKPDREITKGEDFYFLVTAVNISKKALTVDLTGVVSSMMYTGEAKTLIKKTKIPGIVIGAGGSVTKEIHMCMKEYLEKLTKYNSLKLVVVAKGFNHQELNSPSQKPKYYIDDFALQLFNKDSIKVEFPGTPLIVGEPSDIKVTFTNTVGTELDNLDFTIHGVGLSKQQNKPWNGRLSTDEKHEMTFTITPWRAGMRTLFVDVDSSQVDDFKGFATTKVSKSCRH